MFNAKWSDGRDLLDLIKKLYEHIGVENDGLCLVVGCLAPEFSPGILHGENYGKLINRLS